jgi:hypothetical protein
VNWLRWILPLGRLGSFRPRFTLCGKVETGPFIDAVVTVESRVESEVDVTSLLDCDLIIENC